MVHCHVVLRHDFLEEEKIDLFLDSKFKLSVFRYPPLRARVGKPIDYAPKQQIDTLVMTFIIQ
jgi:hypothetical protein